jgi:hypothetical protein
MITQKVMFEFMVLSPPNRGKHNVNEDDATLPPMWVPNVSPKAGVVGRPPLEEGDAGKTTQKKGWDMAGYSVEDRVAYLAEKYALLGADYEGDNSPLDDLPLATQIGGEKMGKLAGNLFHDCHNDNYRKPHDD